MIFKAFGKPAGILSAALISIMAFVGAPSAEVICDPEEMPPLATYVDSLVLQDVDWNAVLFYPTEGTRLDSIESQYYRLENHFKFYGLVADDDITESEPPHHFLPLGWRNLKMLTFRWNTPENGTMVRAPKVDGLRNWMPDPAPGGDSVMVTSQPVIYGSYERTRDQVYNFTLFSGCGFLGDEVPSSTDSSYIAWNINDDDTSWDPNGFFAGLEIGEVDSTLVKISWIESYGPDKEFSYAPGDSMRNGTISLKCKYTRHENGEVTLVDSNLGCAHEMTRGLYVTFTDGLVQPGYHASLVVESYEGFHVWRRVNGSENWENIWKLSMNEERDKFYWWWIDYYIDGSTHEPVYVDDSLTPIFGQTDQRVFLDFDVHNGFFYDYAITTFDRGFRPQGGGNDHYILDSTSEENLNAVARRIDFNFPAANDLNRSPAVYAVPNPLRTGKSALEDAKYHNFPGDVVRFVGLTDSSTLKIYSLSGDLIFEVEQNDPDNRNAVWDTRNQKGQEVASGVYIFHTVDYETGEDAYGRLIIIR